MKSKPASAQAGFSLLELLMALTLSLIVIGGIVVQINTSNQRAANEQNQLDLFQESREFMDQMTRDLRQVGYPNPRNVDTSIDPATLPIGLSSATTPNTLDDQDLTFEGGTDPAGNILKTTYSYNPSTANGCPCLERSQEVLGSGASGQVEVQNVQNYTNGNNINIFRYYKDGGTQEVLGPLSWGGNGGNDNYVIAAIDTIRIQLVVQSPYADLKTGVKPVVTLVSTVKVNNCSQATSGQLACTY